MLCNPLQVGILLQKEAILSPSTNSCSRSLLPAQTFMYLRGGMREEAESNPPKKNSVDPDWFPDLAQGTAAQEFALDMPHKFQRCRKLWTRLLWAYTVFHKAFPELTDPPRIIRTSVPGHLL